MTIEKLPVGDSESLRAIVSFCNRNYTENLSLSLLEEKLHLNKFYISHLLSGKLGLHFNDYINSLRVSEACRYLTNSDYNITEIGSRVGFNTPRTFNRAFIKQMGVSPTEYRKQRLSRTAASAPAPVKDAGEVEKNACCEASVTYSYTEDRCSELDCGCSEIDFGCSQI
jgi:AraC-like DNA-binding protein